MDNRLRILITGELKTDSSSVTSLNNQIRTLESKIKKLDLGFNFDTSALRDFSNQIKNIQSIASKQLGLKVDNTSIDKVKESYKSTNGEVSKLAQRTTEFTNSANQTVKFIEKINTETQKVASTTTTVTENLKASRAAAEKLANQMADGRIKAQALMEQLEYKKQYKLGEQWAKEINDRLKLEQNYSNWWGKALKDREIKESQAIQRRQANEAKAQEKIALIQNTFSRRLQELNPSISLSPAITNFQNKLGSLDLNSTKADIQVLNNLYKDLVNQQKALTASSKETEQQLKRVTDLKNKSDYGRTGLQEQKANEILSRQYDKIISQIKSIQVSGRSLNDSEVSGINKRIERLNRLIQQQKQLEQQQKKQASINSFTEKLNFNADRLQQNYGKYVDQNALKEVIKDMSNLRANMPNLQQEQARIAERFRQISASASDAKRAAFDFGGALKNAFQKFPVWLVAGNITMGVMNFFKDGIHYVNEFNKSLTELSIVWMKSQKEVVEFGAELHKIGMEMSITSQELGKGAAELARQGLSQAETFSRMRTITEYAKISNLSFDESVKIMTASINSMGVTAERASDVFAYLGDSTAADAAEIGQSMQRMGGTIGALGIEFEKASSWVATVSARTRESAYTIGNSIKSILARVQSLKENGFDEEDGTQVNQVAKALAEVGIQLVDAQGNFRNFGTVMDELGGKWDSLSNRQKAYVATTVAGSYQQSRFLNLMQGYSESVKLYEGALNSAGIAHKKFELYQEGTQAKLDKMKEAYAGVFQQTFDTQGIQTLIDSFTRFLDVAGKTIKFVGAFPVLFAAANVTLLIFSKTARTAFSSMIAFSASLMRIPPAARSMNIAIGTASIQTAGLGKVARVSAAGLAVLRAGLLSLAAASIPIAAFTILAIVIEKLTSKLMEAKQRQEEIEQINNSLTESYSTQGEKVDALAQKYAELNAERSRLGELSNEKEEEYLRIQNELGSLIPTLIDHYDEEGRARLKNVNAIQEEILHIKELTDLKNKEKIASAGTDVTDIQGKYEETKKQLESVKRIIDEYKKGLEINPNSEYYKKQIDTFKVQYYQLTRDMMIYQDQLKGITEDITNSILSVNKIKLEPQTSESFKEFINSLSTEEIAPSTYKNIEEIALIIGNIQNQLSSDNFSQFGFSKALDDLKMKMKSTFNSSEADVDDFIEKLIETSKSLIDVKETTSEAIATEKEFTEAYDNTSKSISTYNELLQKAAEGKSISADEAAELIAKEKDIANAFTFENGMIKVNAEAITTLKDTKLKSFFDIATARAKDLSNQNSNLVQKLNNYGIEIKAIQSVADAQKALAGIDTKMQGANSIAEAMDYEKTKRNVEDVKSQFEQIESLKKLISSPSFGIKDGKDKSSSKSTYVADSEAAKQLLVIETEITRLQSERSGLLTYSQKYRDNIEKEKQQLQKKVELLKEEFALVSKTQIVNGKVINKKYPEKLSDDARKKAADLEQQIIKTQESISTLSFDQANSSIEDYTNKITEVDAALSDLRSQQENHAKGSKEYQSAVEGEIALLELKKQWLHSSNDSIREQLTLEGLTEKQIEELNKKIRDNSKAWTEADNDIKASNFLKEQSDITDVFTGKLDIFNTMLSVTRKDSDEYNGLLVARNGLENQVIGSLQAEINKREELIRKGGLSQETVRRLRSEIDQLRSKKVNIEVQISQRKSFTEINNEKFMEWADELANNFDHKKNRIIDELNELKDAAESVFADIDQGFKDITTDPIFNLDNALGKTPPTSALDVDTVDSYAEALEKINQRGQDYKETAEQTNEIIKDHSLNDGKLEQNIRNEIKHRNKILEQVQKEKDILKQKESIYKQQEAMLEREISLIEKRNQFLLDGINKKLQVDSSMIDWSEITDKLYEVYGDRKLSLNGKRVDLGDSISIGDVSTDPRKFLNGVSATNKKIANNDKKADEIQTRLERQKELEYEIAKLKQNQSANIEEIKKKEEELAKLQKQNKKDQSDLQKIIASETETLNELQEKQKAINDELRDRKQFYQDEEDAIKKQIELIEQSRSKMLDTLKDKMQDKFSNVFDLGKFADDLNALPSLEKINLNANINIGDVSTSVSSIYGEIVGYNNQLLNFNKNSSLLQTELNNKLSEQERIQNKINKLALEGKENTEEYKNLKIQLANIDSDIASIQGKINSNIESQIALNDKLIELERKIADEIRDKNIVFEQQKSALESQIEQKQKELELLDEQYEKEDRLLKLQELRDEIAKVKSDKRFEYINDQGQVELTYDKAKVAELEKQLADTEKDYAREDTKKAKQKEIDQLQENIKKLQEEHDKEIAILQAYLNNISEFRSKLENNINKSIDSLDGLYQKEINNKNAYLSNLQTSHAKVISQLELQATVIGQLIESQREKINQHIAALELSFGQEVEQKQQQLEEMKAIHEADLEAHRNYITGLEGLVDKLNNNIASKIDALATSLQGIIDKVRSGDLFGIDASMNPSSGESAGSDVPDHMQTDKSNYTPPPKEDKRGRKEKYHDGGSVSNPNPTGLAAFANSLLNKNLSSDEVEIIAQKNEIMSPVKNFTKNLIPNMRRFVDYAITPFTQSQSISKDTNYTIQNLNVTANDPMELFRNLNRLATQSTMR